MRAVRCGPVRPQSASIRSARLAVSRAGGIPVEVARRTYRPTGRPGGDPRLTPTAPRARQPLGPTSMSAEHSLLTAASANRSARRRDGSPLRTRRGVFATVLPRAETVPPAAIAFHSVHKEARLDGGGGDGTAERRPPMTRRPFAGRPMTDVGAPLAGSGHRQRRPTGGDGGPPVEPVAEDQRCGSNRRPVGSGGGADVLGRDPIWVE